jgi:hypothetical protein
MRWVLSVFIIFILSLFIPHRAHAIIFLPAIVLIPIAKIIALIIGGLSVPVLGLGTLWSKLFKKSLKRTIFVTIIVFAVLLVVLAIFLKLHNPDRPLF